MTPQPGHLVVHHRVLDTLGAGGMGVVFGAGDTMLSRRVALKVPLARHAVGRQWP